jgi:hypothetical protein
MDPGGGHRGGSGSKGTSRAQLRRISRAEDGRPLCFDFSGFYFAVGFEFRGELDLHDPADAGEASTPDGS